MWNVRGINAVKKQRYLDWLVEEHRPDIIIFNETKLAHGHQLHLQGMYSRVEVPGPYLETLIFCSGT